MSILRHLQNRLPREDRNPGRCGHRSRTFLSRPDPPRSSGAMSFPVITARIAVPIYSRAHLLLANLPSITAQPRTHPRCRFRNTPASCVRLASCIPNHLAVNHCQRMFAPKRETLTVEQPGYLNLRLAPVSRRLISLLSIASIFHTHTTGMNHLDPCGLTTTGAIAAPTTTSKSAFTKPSRRLTCPYIEPPSAQHPTTSITHLLHRRTTTRHNVNHRADYPKRSSPN
jgi:hypothetical protein